MSFTQKLNLILCADGATDWGTSLNSNFTKIDTEISEQKTSLDTHITATNAHSASNIACNPINGQITVQSALQSINDVKASVDHIHTNLASATHTHADYALTEHIHSGADITTGVFASGNSVTADLTAAKSKLDEILSKLDEIIFFTGGLNPDISNINLNVSMECLDGGIRINGDVSPDILIRRFNVIVKNGLTNDLIASTGISNSLSLFIPGNFHQGQSLKVDAQVVIGKNTVVQAPCENFIYNRFTDRKLYNYSFIPTSDSHSISMADLRNSFAFTDKEFFSPNIMIQLVASDEDMAKVNKNFTLVTEGDQKVLSKINLSGLTPDQQYFLTINGSKKILV